MYDKLLTVEVIFNDMGIFFQKCYIPKKEKNIYITSHIIYFKLLRVKLLSKLNFCNFNIHISICVQSNDIFQSPKQNGVRWNHVKMRELSKINIY